MAIVCSLAPQYGVWQTFGMDPWPTVALGDKLHTLLGWEITNIIFDMTHNQLEDDTPFARFKVMQLHMVGNQNIPWNQKD
jgi:hypothetical protein